MKIRSVSRSFSRRKHNTQHSVTMESAPFSQNNNSHIHFNFKPGKGGSIGSGKLYSKLRGEAAALGGRAGPGRKESSKSTAIEVEQNKEVLILNSLYNGKDYKKAIEVGRGFLGERRSLRLNPSVHFLLGMCEYKLENYRGAQSHFEEVLRLKDRYKKSVYLFLAICLNNLKEYEAAVGVLGRASAFYPNFYEAKVATADGRYTLGKCSARPSDTKRRLGSTERRPRWTAETRSRHRWALLTAAG